MMEEEEVTASTDLGNFGNDDGNEFVCRSISNKSYAKRAAAVACAPTPCLAVHWRSARGANLIVRVGNVCKWSYTVFICISISGGLLLLMLLLLIEEIFFSATPSWLWRLMLPREDGRAIANSKDLSIPWVNTT